MKKTYFKVIVREIKDSFGRFAAIFGIVALGVGFLSGLLVTTPDMHLSVDEYYDANNMTDIFIKATMGLTNKDIKEVSSMNQVKELMPLYSTDTLMITSNDEVLATRVYGLPLIGDKSNISINKLELIEGRMPLNKNEALVENSGSFLSDIELGSKLIISEDNEDYDDIGDIYKTTEYTVVGVVGNSFHFSMEREVTSIGNGRLGAIIYVDESSYALDVYTDFYITVEGAMEMDSFSKEYESSVEKVVYDLEKLGEDRSVIRYNEVLSEAKKELSDGWKEYEEAKLEAETELADALLEIEDGKIELADGLKKINDGKKELADAKVTLAEEVKDAQIKIADGKKELSDALIELEDGDKELADAWNELQDGQIKYQDGYKEYLDAKLELEDGQKEFDDGEEKYLDGMEKLADGQREIRKGERQLADARDELEAGERELEEGIEELEYQKNQFLTQVDPLAKNIGYSSSDDMVKAIERNPSELSGRLSGVEAQLQGGIDKIEAGISQLEAGISQIEAQLGPLKSIPEPSEEDLANISALEIEIAELNGQLAGYNQELQGLKVQQAAIPEASTLIGGWNAILDGEEQLEDGAEELANGRELYEEGRAELREGKKELEDAEKELSDAKKEIEENRKKLEDGWIELDEGRIELEDARKKLEDGFREYEDGSKEIEEGWTEYRDGLVEIEDAEITLLEEVEKANIEIRDAEKDLHQGQIDYNEGVIELKDGEKEYEEGKLEAETELADAEQELKDAEKDIDDLKIPEWYVLDRNSNTSFVSFDLNAEKVAAVAKVFPIFFYLVAALVALTTMTRMVEEERTQIGTLKALGYTKTSIVAKYLVYCGLAGILGSIAGQLVGFKVIPIVIWNAYGYLYRLPNFITQYNTKIAYASSGLAILSTMGAAVYACNEALKEKPATLMLPRAPKAGKRIMLERISFIWSRMSFNHKATARNLFRYKKHFFMTVIGIAGCTGLLVTGFGIRDSVGDLGSTQFTEIFKYDLEIEIDHEKISNLDEILNDKNKIDDYIGAFSDKGEVIVNKYNLDATMMVIDDTDKFDDFVDLRNRKANEKIAFNKYSVVITEKLSEELDLSVGDTFEYMNTDDVTAEFIVTGITENYLGNYVYMSQEGYEEAYGLSISFNRILANTPIIESLEQDELISELLSEENVLNANIVSQTKTSFDNLLTSIDYIVVVIIIASGLLAFIVLYNLTNININERKKELATLKVLGFHNEEVSSYIFRETAILTIIGILVGLLLGRLLHGFIISTIENPEYMFGRDIAAISYGLSAIITVIFSIIVNLFMSKKLRNIKMVDSMKAND